jgi:hypothetical protein
MTIIYGYYNTIMLMLFALMLHADFLYDIMLIDIALMMYIYHIYDIMMLIQL